MAKDEKIKAYNNDLKYKVFKDYGVVDEKGSMYISARNIAWYNASTSKEEPDESKARFEIRKWKVTEDGKDLAQKGVTFLTEDGPHELTHTLVNNGFGKTKDILLSLKTRDDFKDAVEHMYDGDDIDSSEFFDARTTLLSDDIEVSNF